jgi:excisionase family DNA binding protein
MDGTVAGQDGTGGTGHVPYTQVTVAEAAAVLGVNVVTIRRMIKRGQLEAERVHRPQGSAYLVKLPGHGADDAIVMGQSVQDMSRTQGTPAPAPADAMVSLIQTTIGTVLGPLVAAQAALRQAVERQTGALRELERENGRLTAENEALRAAQAVQDASGAPQPLDPSPRSHLHPLIRSRCRCRPHRTSWRGCRIARSGAGSW